MVPCSNQGDFFLTLKGSRFGWGKSLLFIALVAFKSGGMDYSGELATSLEAYR
jgi:hypothetical protein